MMTKRSLLLLGAASLLVAFVGVGLFIASRVVQWNYYDDRLDYRTANRLYIGLTWGGSVTFVLGVAGLIYVLIARRRQQKAHYIQSYNMHAPPPAHDYYPPQAASGMPPPPTYQPNGAYYPPQPPPYGGAKVQ
ncbi:hypothetical protein H4R35_007659 [Dimargaris xerosporica]|nr:hypothetical protein H4R35_007659 [Dimargaris xerosporica]